VRPAGLVGEDVLAPRPLQGGKLQVEVLVAGRDLRIAYFHGPILSLVFGTGRDCAAIRPGYRKHGVGRHIIFYRSIADDCIEIVRVLHERMDAERHLSEPGAG
jgi:hypothetical protein